MGKCTGCGAEGVELNDAGLCTNCQAKTADAPAEGGGEKGGDAPAAGGGDAPAEGGGEKGGDAPAAE